MVGEDVELSHTDEGAGDLDTPVEDFSHGEIGVFKVAVELSRDPGEIIEDFKRWLPKILAEQDKFRSRIAARFRYLAVLVTARALAGQNAFKASAALHARWILAVRRSPPADIYFFKDKDGTGQLEFREAWARAISMARQ